MRTGIGLYAINEKLGYKATTLARHRKRQIKELFTMMIKTARLSRQYRGLKISTQNVEK